MRRAPLPGQTRTPVPTGVKIAALSIAVLLFSGIGFAFMQVQEFFDGTKLVSNLEEGDCLTNFFDARNDEFIDVFLVEVTECENPHAMEVFADTDQVFVGEGFAYPGVDAAFDMGYEWCYRQFEVFVGESYDTSPLEMWTFVPNGQSWNQGDRKVSCIVGSFDEMTLVTGTLRNSAGRTIT